MNDVIGEDPSYAPEFLELAAAVADRTVQGQATNWTQVERASSAFLETCKDVRAMTWLALAKSRTRGYEGATEGLALYREFVERFWERAHPKPRGRVRANFVATLWEGLGRALTELPAMRAELECLDALVMEVDALLADRLRDQNPGPRALRLVLKDRLDTLTPEGPAEAPPVVVDHVAAPAIVAPPASVPASIPIAVAAPPTNLGEIREALRSLAREARSTNLADPLAYRWARTAAWIAITEPPDAEAGRTHVKAPSRDERQELESLATRQQWRELVEASESALERSIWWLDVHRLAALALTRLGADHEIAARTVRSELQAFVARLPSVETLAFADGTPFASPETRALLAPAPVRSPAESGGDPLPGGDDTGTIAETVTGALALPPGRRRFSTLLRAASRAADENQLRAARSLCESLLPEATPTLEAWEPDLCAELFALHLRTLGEADAPLRDALYRRLLTTNPTQALRI